MNQNTEAVEVRAGQLERRQHVVIVERHQHVVYRVEHVLPFTDGDGHPMTAVMLNPVGLGEPVGKRWSADAMIRCATDDQVAAAVEAAHRMQLVAGLRDLADLIEQHELRFRSWYGIDVNAVLPEGEVSRVSELLGVELTGFSSEQRQVQWHLRKPDHGEGVTVTFRGIPAAEPTQADDLCTDPWHEQPTEPTDPCPACGDQPPAAPTQAGE